MQKRIGRTMIFNNQPINFSGGDKVKNISYNDLFSLYVKDCKLRNIQDVTIKGYAYAHKYFSEFINLNKEIKADILCSDITQSLIDDYVIYLSDKFKPQTVNSYVFKVSPVVLFGTARGYIKNEIKFTHMVTQEHFKDIYTDEEIRALLKKPNNKSFTDYRSWVMVNLFLGTGIRAQECRELQNRDFDLDNKILSLRHTKNKKPRMIPLTESLANIISEYLNIRNGAPDEIAFCNIYGEPMARTSLQQAIIKFNHSRGVEKTSLHLFRHTFITLSVRSGVSPLLLKRITGHKGLKELDNYYNFNTTDLVQVIENINPLQQFKTKKTLQLNNKFKKY